MPILPDVDRGVQRRLPVEQVAQDGMAPPRARDCALLAPEPPVRGYLLVGLMGAAVALLPLWLAPLPLWVALPEGLTAVISVMEVGLIIISVWLPCLSFARTRNEPGMIWMSE